MPTNDNIHFRINDHPSTCPFCPNSVENIYHILRKCQRAIEIWGSVKFVVANEVSFSDWIKTNYTKDHNRTGTITNSIIPSNVEFIFTVWAIWLRRNAWVFNRKNITSSSSLNSSHWAATEWFFSQSQSKVGKAPNPSPHSQQLTPTPRTCAPNSLSNSWPQCTHSSASNPHQNDGTRLFMVQWQPPLEPSKN